MTVFLSLLLITACKQKEEPAELVDAVCDPSAEAWNAGTPAFHEVTEAWGLTAIAPNGVRMSAVDIDHDGWTDLVVRRGAGADDFNEGGVRQVWLLRNDHAKGFVDITQSSGIAQTRSGADANLGRPGPVYVFGDIDNDGDLDLYSGNPDSAGTSTETSEVLLGDGAGKFALAAEDNDIRRGAGDMPYGAVFVDYDLDGTLDLYTAQYSDASAPQQSLLYHGNGDGTFAENTRDAGMITKPWSSVAVLNLAGSHTNSWAALACDLNNDGSLELLASSYGRSPNHLWLNNGDATFTNRSVPSGYAYDERVDWTDNESARCWCTLHPEAEDCEDVPPPQNIVCNDDDDAFRWDHDFDRELFRLGGNSGATQCGDLDNDGWMDLVTSEIVHWDVGASSDPSEILHNLQDPEVAFERPGNDVTGLTRVHEDVDWNDGDMTGSIFDFDNDGWNDVWIGSSDYPGDRGLLWHQEAPLQFAPVPLADGIDHTRSHGSAIADFDRDGDLDIVVGHSSSRCEDDCYDTFVVRMFENDTAGNWLQIEALGAAGTNTKAIGARVTVKTTGNTQTHQIDGGHGQFGAQDDLVQHFGLGKACEAEVTITWPTTGLPSQTVTLPAGHRWRIIQGENTPTLIDVAAD